MELLVLKFGGSVLEDDKAIAKAVDMVKSLLNRGFGVVVVVSALKGVTNSLVDLVRRVSPNAPPSGIDEVLAMGERTSARLFANALLSNDVKARLVDPESDLWPIISDSTFTDANPIYTETKMKIQEKLKPLVESGEVPVVCGFVGKTRDGRITTLGRGGSDTTAIIIGSALEAKEVVLVKDVESVFSSDPDRVQNAVAISHLDAEEAFALAAGGAKFLQAKALQYKRGDVKVRIVSMSGSILAGTVIDGGSLDMEVTLVPDDITMVTVVGEGISDPQVIHSVVDELKKGGGSLVSLAVGPRSVTLYASNGTKLVQLVHDLTVKRGFGKAVSFFENLTTVVIRGSAMETSPGMIQRAAQPLARQGINIFGLVTQASSIRMFVSRKDAEKAASLLKHALMVTD